MKIKPILIGLILLCFMVMPVFAEAEGTIKVLDKDKNVIKTSEDKSASSYVTHGSEVSTEKEEEKNTESDTDVWGIQQSDMGFESLVNLKTLGNVYMGITPFRNMSIISISISAGLALTFVIVGIFILLMLAGVGAGHPNVTKGWNLLRGAQGKIAAVGLIFGLALFIIIVVFFTLTIFGKIIIIMAA